MNYQLAQFSIVVVGKSHNPSILNPTFLKVRRIVPEEWEEKETITTPPFASIDYETGVSLIVEHEKLQFIDHARHETPIESKVASIAKKYIETLPHVAYKAVGVNFHIVVPMVSPEIYLKERFLKSGSWDTTEYPISAVGLRLVFDVIKDGRLMVSLDVGEASNSEQSESETRRVVMVRANFHRDCKGYPAEDQVVSYIDRVEDDWSTLERLLKNLFAEGK